MTKKIQTENCSKCGDPYILIESAAVNPFVCEGCRSQNEELPVLQFDRLRNNVSSLASAAELSGVSVMGLYPDILQDITSIENAFYKYMRVNDQLVSINSELMEQNKELRNVQI